MSLDPISTNPFFFSFWEEKAKSPHLAKSFQITIFAVSRYLGGLDQMILFYDMMYLGKKKIKNLIIIIIK